MKPDRKKNLNPNRPVSPKISDDVEPVADSSPIPIWIFPLLGLLLLWGQLYLDREAGGFNSRVYEPYASLKAVTDDHPKTGAKVQFETGRRLYGPNCSVCHQANGLGTPGQFPPLAGSEWVLAEGPNRLIRIPMHGLTGPIAVKGENWNLNMPAMGAALNDEEMAAVLTYIRQDWGNNASAVTPAQVKAVRDATAGRSDQWTAAELSALPEAVP